MSNINSYDTAIPLNGIQVPHGATATRSLRSRDDATVVIGKIVQVSPDANTISVVMVQNKGQRPDIPLTFPGMGYSSFMGVMPEVDGQVVLIRSSGTNTYYPIAFLPPDPHGGFKYRMLEKYPKSASTEHEEFSRIVPSRMRRMAPGDAYVSSSGGGEVFLDYDVELRDGGGNEFRIRSGDSSMMSTSRNNFMFTNGVWRSAGYAMRNSLNTTLNGESLESQGVHASRVTSADGREQVYVGGTFEHGGTMAVEYRLEVEDFTTLHSPLNDVNSEGNITPRTPVVEFLLGNMIGNKEKDASYGKMLAPNFIGDVLTTNTEIVFDTLVRNGTYDNQYGNRGMAWAYHQPGTAFLGSDKLGQTHRYMGASLGANAGWSMQTAAKGGRRDSWGKSRNNGISWEMATSGSVDWRLGAQTGSPNKKTYSRSLTLRMERGSYIEHGNGGNFVDGVVHDLYDDSKSLDYTSIDGYAKIERAAGDVREEVTGKYELSVGSDLLWDIGGGFKYSIGGSFSESVMGDRTISTTSAFSTNSNELKNISGSRSEKITHGNDMKTILLGNEVKTLVAGNVVTAITAGNIVETMPAGNRVTTVGAGSVGFNVGTGSFTAATGAGALALTTAAGTVTFAGTVISATALTAISHQAPIVGLGMLPTRSGVITMLSHRDYITGMPLIPSLTVTASV